MFVKERFTLARYTQDTLRNLEPNFGYDGYGEFIYYRTYSRIKKDGGQENWADTVIRVVEGVFSIRKDWYLKNNISWNEKYWQEYAYGFAISLFNMEWMPAGRGLWAMGTEFVYARGGMALQNCGYLEILNDDLADDLGWTMDSLMLGVGVGFSPIRDDTFKFKLNHSINPPEYVIPDSREGWVESVHKLITACVTGSPIPRFIYDEIRPAGLPINGFGGTASGPEPLIALHCELPELFDRYMVEPYYDSVLLKTDCQNIIGQAVVAGGVRRTAELACLSIKDPTFKHMKDYDKYPYREKHGWMSNNSVDLEDDKDFELLDEVAKLVITRGEPGIKNLQNFPYGRIGKKIPVRKDRARGVNPCSEQALEGKFDLDNRTRVRETCNIDETYPTVCNDPYKWLKATEHATFYCSTVSLLLTHQPSTNRVIARNRRIGVSIVDVTGWIADAGVNKVTKWMRQGYDSVTEINQRANGEAGVPESVRKTTIKPGGTTPKLAGKVSGIGYATFNATLRRTRISKNHPLVPLLIEANMPYEEDVFDKYTWVFESPILQTGKPAYDVTLWQQAMNLVLVQREWSDNSVSNTLYFKPKWVLTKVFDNINNPVSAFETHIQHIFSHDEYVDVKIAVENEEPEYQNDHAKLTFRYDDETGDIVEVKSYIFDPKHEENDIEPVLSMIAPLIKTASLLPHSITGAYKQMPEEGISHAEYLERKSKLKKIDWKKLSGSDGQDERYCQGPSCELPIR